MFQEFVPNRPRPLRPNLGFVEAMKGASMAFRQRPLPIQERPSRPSGDSGPVSSSVSQTNAETLLAAGDQLIRRVLSTDSREYLNDNRQDGGE